MQTRLRRIGFATAIAIFWSLAIPQHCPGQGSWEDYQRSESYGSRTANLVFADAVDPHWFGEKQDQMWYRVRTGKDSHQYILVDCAVGKRRVAMNHQKLANQLTAKTKRKVDPTRLQLRGLAFADDKSSCRFRFAEQSWQFMLPDGPLSAARPRPVKIDRAAGLEPKGRIVRSVDSDQRAPIQFDNRLDQPLEVIWMPSSGRPVSYGKVDAKKSFEIQSYSGHAWVLRLDDGAARAAFVVSPHQAVAVIDAETPKPKPLQGEQHPQRPNAADSPNGKFRVVLRDHNVRLIEIASGDELYRTSDGKRDHGYQSRVWWSPDSKHFVVMKTKVAERRRISMIESAPKDSIHSKLITIDYAKPGDELDRPRPVLFHVDDPNPVEIDDELFPNPFGLGQMHWNDASDEFSFRYNQRGHQVLRVVGVNAISGKTRTIIEDVSDTFVCYSSKSFLHRVSDDELIWMSERSGWNHLYLIDQKTGSVKNSITSGEWVVRRVERVDNDARQIWLTVSGIDPQQDPYHGHLVRVDFDGQNLVRLTEGDGDHLWQFSPRNDFLIDTYSRVDSLPVNEIRDANTGRLVCALEQADATKLLATGWQFPERFVAKGRDGQTDIHGIIVRPTNFDPKKRYPVLESIYAGPQSAFVPKRFGRHRDLYDLAELGFIVVKIDGMGTSHRSKAFHDVCWKNLADSGFADRIAWITAAAKDRPEMDLDRVGIWGGSAGGQSAMRALIAHGDFYHAAVADCGCHDNRVDKIWWNEQWMGWPIGPHYAQQSNATQAHRLRGDLMLIWGELDHNVDPASTMQVIDALIRADKDFQQLIMPGVGHGAAGRPYAKRQQADFFVRKLWHRKPRHRTDTGRNNLIVAKTPSRDLLLDLYMPHDVADPPLVVFIHGGGWQSGSYKNCKVSWLTDYGFAVASISYRLTDEATFPAQIHDCKAAVRWLRGNADRFGYDANRIAVAGTSAGGQLAALLGTSADVPQLEGDLGFYDHESSRVQAVVDFYGATDFILRSKTQPHRANEPGSVVYKLLGGGANKKTELARLASAVAHVTDDDPPMLVLHGAKDKTVLLDQSERITQAYQQQGLEISLRVLPDAGHGGDQFMKGEHRAAIVKFLNKHIKPGESQSSSE